MGQGVWVPRAQDLWLCSLPGQPRGAAVQQGPPSPAPCQGWLPLQTLPGHWGSTLHQNRAQVCVQDLY